MNFESKHDFKLLCLNFQSRITIAKTYGYRNYEGIFLHSCPYQAV